jgi:hypothetical protein
MYDFFRFLDLILRVLRLEVSVYNAYITNQLQTTFAQRGGGGVKSVSRGDCESKRKTLKTFVTITSMNAPSALYLQYGMNCIFLRLTFFSCVLKLEIVKTCELEVCVSVF